MSKTQKLLLFLFAGMIFFHSSALYESSIETYLRLFFSGILIVLSISPINWFVKPSSLNIISSEGLTVFTALLKLRSFEITTAYSTIREYQEKVGQEGNWVALFMKELSTIPNDPWTEYSKEKQKGLEDKALKKFKENYEFGMAPLDLYRDRIKDVKIALLFYDVGSDYMQKNLRKLREFGVMQEQIDRLIKLYGRLGSGSFYALFGSDPRKFFRRMAFYEIQLVWAQIIGVLKMQLLLEKMKQRQQKSNIKIKELLEEIAALEDLEASFDLAVTQVNAKRLGSSASKENEELLLSQLRHNPFWN